MHNEDLSLCHFICKTLSTQIFKLKFNLVDDQDITTFEWEILKNLGRKLKIQFVWIYLYLRYEILLGNFDLKEYFFFKKKRVFRFKVLLKFKIFGYIFAFKPLKDCGLFSKPPTVSEFRPKNF